MLGFLRRRARRDGVPDGRSGAVAIVQRFGGALNLNVHLHALVLDGVFVLDEGVVKFHPVRRLMREDVAAVVALIARRVERLLGRRGRRRRRERGAGPLIGGGAGPRCRGGSVRRRPSAARAVSRPRRRVQSPAGLGHDVTDLGIRVP